MYTLYLITENLTNGYKSVSLIILSLTSILFGISVIISKNPIVSVLFLIMLFCAISVYLITLGLYFIGLSYLLVYVGAISILFIFILMLINVRVSELITDNTNSIPLAILVVLAFSIPVNYAIPNSLHMYDIKYINITYLWDLFNYNMVDVSSNNSVSMQTMLNMTGSVTSNVWDANLSETSHITAIGNVLYTNYFVWLIVTSLILLLAMVGTIVITVKDNPKTNVKKLSFK
jgi:NADH-ubiquinone oxidoreductase chain 6